MLTSYSFTLVLFSLLYALFAQTAILPATFSLNNNGSVGLHIVNEPGTPLATGVTRIPVSWRDIVLAFLSRGQPIPEDEVKDTLVDADESIADLARNLPTERITNDRFEYRRPNGNMLIIISANEGEKISWQELNRILHALHRYMTGGIGAQETHYQVLEFEVEASGQEKPNIGLGLVWYFEPTESEVQKRFSLSPSTSLDEGTLRLPNLTFPALSSEIQGKLPNTTLILEDTVNMQEPTLFPIPRTSLSLSFHLFGPPIPARNLEATIQGAMAEVRSKYLNGPYENDPIENNGYRWILPLSREAGIPVAVTVFTYHNHVITWRQLFDVLIGLFAFTTTFGTELPEPHYQSLGFRVLDQRSSRLGVGTISYFRTEASQPAKRAEPAHNGSPLGPRSARSLSILETVASPIVYPVANSDVTLSFTFLGVTTIPSMEIAGAIIGAQERIFPWVAHNPRRAIPGRFEYISASGRVSINILVYVRHFITWREVDQILKGVQNFCQDDEDYDRVLVFEIDIGARNRGRVGFGTLLYVPPNATDTEKRALAAEHTSLQLTDSTILSKPSRTIPFPYPIPGTPITLTLSTFGIPIPSRYVNAAFTSALRQIQTQVIHHPNQPIPNGRWDRRGILDRIGIAIVAYPGGRISWQELSYVLAGVLGFMTEAGEHRCRELGFYIDKDWEGEEATGYGSVIYYSTGNNSLGTGQ